MTKYDTRRSCAQKVDSTAIGYHVGDPPNNHLKKKKNDSTTKRNRNHKMSSYCHKEIGYHVGMGPT